MTTISIKDHIESLGLTDRVTTVNADGASYVVISAEETENKYQTYICPAQGPYKVLFGMSAGDFDTSTHLHQAMINTLQKGSLTDALMMGLLKP